jgi:hypothetical protein
LRMEFRTDSNNRVPDREEEVNALDPALPPNDDQRSHPRGSTIERIADIAYDTLRRHEGSYEAEASSGERNTPEDSE